MENTIETQPHLVWELVRPPDMREHLRCPGEQTLEDLGNVLAMSAEDVGRLVSREHIHRGGTG